MDTEYTMPPRTRYEVMLVGKVVATYYDEYAARDSYGRVQDRHPGQLVKLYEVTWRSIDAGRASVRPQ